MEMVLIPVSQLRDLIIEGASVAVKNLAQRPQPPKTEQDELLTPEETAKLLKVSKVTVWDWTANRGILTKHTIGNQVRYLKSEVLAAVIGKEDNDQPEAATITRRKSANPQTRKAV